jgi:predicted AlkP superfamily phosphohydrolase/phosphomutase
MTRLQVKLIAFLFLTSGLLFTLDKCLENENQVSSKRPLKLYWFIPDGLRADPDLFKIYEWAEKGLLPNIKKMMDQGSYGYSIPVFPGHTPANFATLLTGKKPSEHGVTDGPIRLPGYHVKRVSASGFSSSTREVDAIWNYLDREGLTSTLLSVPGSTPPDSDNAVIFKGRWGGWGIELPSLIFQSNKEKTSDEYLFKRARHFEFSHRMTHYIDESIPKGWSKSIIEKAGEGAYEIKMNAYNNFFYGLIYDLDSSGTYKKLLVSKNKKTVLLDVVAQEWSDWIQNIDWSYRLKEDKATFNPSKPDWEKDLSAINFQTSIKIKPIKLGKKGDFRIRFLLDGINPYLVQPFEFESLRNQFVGPFVDYPDNYPAQLITSEQDKETFLEELHMSFDSHKKLLDLAINKIESDVIIHNIYSPNQMLTSRWWLGAIDPLSSFFETYDDDERSSLKGEILAMYKRVDEMLGHALKNKGDDTVIVLSSDHGVSALNYEVRLNNFFAKKGWLSFKKDSKTGELKIDWKRTKAVYLKMYHVYINPDGLGGAYNIKGKKDGKYLKFRNEVISALKSLKGPKHEEIFAGIKVRESADDWELAKNRVGDILISNNPPFNWSESVSEDRVIFVKPKVAGYKQAIDPTRHNSLWTPFIILGPNIKKGFKLSNKIRHYDQLPVILKAMGLKGTEASYPLSEKTQEIFDSD